MIDTHKRVRPQKLNKNPRLSSNRIRVTFTININEF